MEQDKNINTFSRFFAISERTTVFPPPNGALKIFHFAES